MGTFPWRSLWELGRTLGGKFTEVWEPPFDRASLAFSTLRLVHAERPSKQFKSSPWQLWFFYPTTGSQRGCCLWVSIPVSCESLHSPGSSGDSCLSCDFPSLTGLRRIVDFAVGSAFHLVEWRNHFQVSSFRKFVSKFEIKFGPMYKSKPRNGFGSCWLFYHHIPRI